MLIEDFTSNIATRLQGDGPSRALDFMGILELIMMLMGNCAMDKADFVKMTSRPSRVQRAILNMHVRRTMGVRGRRKVREVSKAMVAEAASMSEDSLGKAYDEGMAVLHPNEVVFDSL